MCATLSLTGADVRCRHLPCSWQDSGGDPETIPSLTFDEFKAFYSAYYHPSNARFWFYGDDDRERQCGMCVCSLSRAP